MTKQLTRELLIKIASEHFKGRTAIRYLGLPAAGCLFERLLTESFPDARMEGWDMDPEVVRKARSMTWRRGLPLRVHLGDLHQSDSLSDFIWADYCGCLSMDRLQGLQKLVRDNLDLRWNRSPLLAFTLLRGREDASVWREATELPRISKREALKMSPEVASETIRRHGEEWDRIRRSWVPERLNMVLAPKGRHLEVARYVEYWETSPMILVICKIGKGACPVPPFEVEMWRKKDDLDRIVRGPGTGAS